MQASAPGFPAIVGLAGAGSGAAVEAVVGALRGMAAPHGVVVVALQPLEEGGAIETALDAAGIECRELSPAAAGPLRVEELELIEDADALLLVAAPPDSAAASREQALASCAQALGCPVAWIDPASGQTTGELAAPDPARDEWLPALFAAAGLAPEAGIPAIGEKMDALANQAAPRTRGWWHWIVFLQGLAVLAPMCWLVRHLLGVPVSGAAAISLGSVLLLVGVNWWLRWRGMQKTWARARLVGEVARSILATAGCPSALPAPDLRVVPALRHLRWRPRPAPGEPAGPDWRAGYIARRIDDQEDYFGRKQAEAAAQRKNLTRWATLLLDLALVFALAGAVLYMSEAVREWVRAWGGEWPAVALGLIGTMLPVGVLLLEALRTLQELNRRTARFAQQREVLARARARLAAAPTEAVAVAVVEDTERHLLAEVFEWYFQTETAEHFFQLVETPQSARGLTLDERPRRFGLARRAVARLGVAGFYFLRVVFGRVIWVVGSALAVVILIFYFLPLARKYQGQHLGEFRDAAGNPWEPTVERAAHGCVIIVHGLHGDMTKSVFGETHWMKRMAIAIEHRIGPAAPNIGLLDWHRAARPSQHHQLGFGAPKSDIFGDVFAIRTQADEVGKALTNTLFEWMQDERIRRDRPLHLIGHSAGGFVITRIALRLKKLNADPAPLHLTLLDTPEPNDEILVELPRTFPGAADYYLTSSLVRIDPAAARPGLRIRRETPPPGSSRTEAHKYANEWFLGTIEKRGSGEGFDRSPLEPARTAP